MTSHAGSDSRSMRPRVGVTLRRMLAAGLSGATFLGLALTLQVGSPASSTASPTATIVPTGYSPVAAHKVPRIAYAARSGDGVDIFSIFPDGSQRRQMTHTGRASAPSWAPMGRRLAFEDRGDIWVTDRRDTIRVTTGDAVDSDPEWAPDGRRLLFTRREFQSQESRIFVHDFGTDTAAPVTEPTEEWPAVGQAAWSPDGSRIAFVRVSSEPYEYIPIRQLFVMDWDGSDLQPIPDTPYPADPSWSPAGDRVMYTYDRYLDREGQCSPAVMSVALDGSEPRRVFKQGCMSRAGSWSPSGSRSPCSATARSGTTREASRAATRASS